MKSHLMNAECLFVDPDAKECAIQLCAKTCCGEKRFTPLESNVFWFLAERDDEAFDDER